MGPDRVILSINADPPIANPNHLVGKHAIVGFRKQIHEAIGASRLEDPIGLLLDDFVGANIISHWVHTRCVEGREARKAVVGDTVPPANVCIGYATGSSALTEDTYLDAATPVPALEIIDDPHAYHPLRPDSMRTARRVRRIDLWKEHGELHIDAMFQDSGVPLTLTRIGIHEYRLHAVADSFRRLSEVSATPGILPHPECLGAPLNLKQLLGLPLAELRKEVLLRLRGPAGCTHLNDALRALSEAPKLAERLA